MTISPYYHQRGIFNPFYILKINPEIDIRPKVENKGEIKFKNVEEGRGTLIRHYGRGKYVFQVVVDDIETDFYIIVPRRLVEGHYGMKTRKNSTASSNVNEFLSVYFLKHKFEGNVRQFQNTIVQKTGHTGIKDGDGRYVEYRQLVGMLDRDESADRDILIGYKNSLEIKKDLKGKTIGGLFWVPRNKPGGIDNRNPSDIIIKLKNGEYVGYSNKITRGIDTTPKFNTNIVPFFSKLGDSGQINTIKKIIDDSWIAAANSVPSKHPNAKLAISTFNIRKEKFSETSSRAKFAKLAQEFKKDKLNFYKEDFYWKFRNNLIMKLDEHIRQPKNLSYFLRSIGYYTYDDPNKTPCPYKLLVGSPERSKITSITSDDNLRDVLFEKNPRMFRDIKVIYKKGQQNFIVKFHHKELGVLVEINIISRTRSSGGWSGKNLFINSPGVKIF